MKKKEYDFALNASVDAHTGWMLWESEKNTQSPLSVGHTKEWSDCINKVCAKRRKFLEKRNPDLRIAAKTVEN